LLTYPLTSPLTPIPRHYPRPSDASHQSGLPLGGSTEVWRQRQQPSLCYRLRTEFSQPSSNRTRAVVPSLPSSRRRYPPSHSCIAQPSAVGTQVRSPHRTQLDKHFTIRWPTDRHTQTPTSTSDLSILYPQIPKSVNQDGGICSCPNLWHDLRDHKQVGSLPTVSGPAGWVLMKIHRYTDLQPVGMGAFGLVWYVRQNLRVLRTLTHCSLAPPRIN